MDLRYMDSNNIVHKPEPKQLIMAYDYAREVSIFILSCWRQLWPEIQSVCPLLLKGTSYSLHLCLCGSGFCVGKR